MQRKANGGGGGAGLKGGKMGIMKVNECVVVVEKGRIATVSCAEE
jgi:hypothetical protein